LAAVLGLAAALRLHGLFTAHLAQVDEISSLNQRDLPWFAGAQADTNFLLTMFLVKALHGIVDFPELRLIPALGSVAAIGLAVFALRPLVSFGVALGTAALLSVSWNLIYFGQLFEVGSFDPIVACLLLAGVSLWIRNRARTGWLVAGGALLGLHFNTHVVPTGYTILLYGGWLALACVAGALRWRVLGQVVAVTVAGLLPFLWTSWGNPALRSAFENSYAAFGQSGSPVWAINLRDPAAALRTLVEYGTSFPLPASAPVQTGLVLGLIVLVSIAAA
jgi:hypothetical protein